MFRFDSDLSRHQIRDSLVIPNSIGWSPDHSTLYFTHSTERKVLAYDYSVKTGNVTNERVFYQHEGPGEPDGFRVDVEGNLWHAVYGESRVLKISPQGKLIGDITYPAKAITCPAFVGTELWTTSATDGETEYGGGLFKIDVGVRGLEPFAFKLDKGFANGSLGENTNGDL
jgi:sugar lactone lactonase YvrE